MLPWVSVGHQLGSHNAETLVSWRAIRLISVVFVILELEWTYIDTESPEDYQRGGLMDKTFGDSALGDHGN